MPARDRQSERLFGGSDDLLHGSKIRRTVDDGSRLFDGGLRGPSPVAGQYGDHRVPMGNPVPRYFNRPATLAAEAGSQNTPSF